jgi:hypothetical protein
MRNGKRPGCSASPTSLREDQAGSSTGGSAIAPATPTRRRSALPDAELRKDVDYPLRTRVTDRGAGMV